MLDVLVAGLVLANVARMLKTGIARNWLANTATRTVQPALYWRYVHTSYAVLAFCAITFLWASFWPDSLR